MNDSFADFLKQLKEGDDDAARRLLERFARQLVALARRRVDGRFKHKVDPEDVVQSAYKSFFYRYAEGNIDIGSWNGLWGLLTIITVRKCMERVAYHRAEKRDATREVSASQRDPASSLDMLSREPTPTEAVELTETVDRLLAGLSEPERLIVELSLQGYSTREISKRLNRAERTVRLLRERVRNRLVRMQGEDA